MKYLLTSGWDDGVAGLTERLVYELAAGKRVLWLVSGGSNIPASVQIIKNISNRLRANLTIMLGDERYGEVGHKDSNFTQLLQAGFKCHPAVLIPVLYPGQTLAQTTANYQKSIQAEFKKSDIIIAQLGMGDDGHIAGILLNSPAALAESKLVSGYDSQPWPRVTLTFAGLKKVNVAYIFAFGVNKLRALAILKNRTLNVRDQPAQILKQLREAYLYNDQVGKQE